MYTEGAQCTANFVFTDDSGATYVGYAAHCAGTGAATDTNGCDAASLPLGTRVDFVEGGSLATEGTKVGNGTLVYSSWLTCSSATSPTRTPAPTTTSPWSRSTRPTPARSTRPCPSGAARSRVNSTGTAAGDRVYSFGNSSLRAGVEALSPKTGISLGAEGNGWSHPVYTVSPGVPGDSGSAFLDAEGNALGTLSTLALAPLAGSNGVGDLRHELTYAQNHGGLAGLRLVPGTEPFSPDPLTRLPDRDRTVTGPGGRVGRATGLGSVPCGTGARARRRRTTAGVPPSSPSSP